MQAAELMEAESVKQCQTYQYHLDNGKHYFTLPLNAGDVPFRKRVVYVKNLRFGLRAACFCRMGGEGADPSVILRLL